MISTKLHSLIEENLENKNKQYYSLIEEDFLLLLCVEIVDTQPNVRTVI